MRCSPSALAGAALGSAHGPGPALPSTSELARQATAAVDAFLGHPPSGPAPPLPLTARLHPLAVERVLDALVLVALAAALVGLGRLLRAHAWPGLRPAVFASGTLALVLYAGVNPSFWRVAAVRLDRHGVTLVRYAAPDRRLGWRDIAAVSVEPGAALPVFQDDRALRLTPRHGEPLEIPRFLPGVERLAAAIPALITARDRFEEPHAPVQR